MNKINELFGSMVFNETVMREKLPKDIYKKLQATIREGKALDINVASSVANAMKDWAIEKEATHYTHWFQPMTGVTAEKHEGFISSDQTDGVILEFSGKELIKGESDASSFPNGGSRSTFEARGYTAWDPSSYAFIKDDTLCIPTIFCSFDGSSLDKKTPLIRSLADLNEQVLRILRLFGETQDKQIQVTVGSEQEYFLIDKEDFLKRDDLRLCGRTLFGAKSPKGQEMDDHYFGQLDARVKAFMNELDIELWKLGVPAKTEHKEVAPRQFEIAPIFETSNMATDHNQLTMELLKKVADKHGFACLLHEKPFKYVNGSGKHNNWSIAANNKNLLEPGETPQNNARFLLFLCAIIKGVDEYQDLLRVSVASASNDHRLGANEAPPAIISIHLGEELMGILEAIENKTNYDKTFDKYMEIGVDILPKFPKDTTDRNRTSPIAFTGNKFEFRMLGSSMSIACPNQIINTIVAEELCQFADELEKSDDFKKTLNHLIRKTIKNHKRILFSGNGYTDEWVKEAEERGLYNLKTTPDTLPYYTSQKNIDLFAKHKILTSQEMHSRSEILFENYNKNIYVEGSVMVDMTKKKFLPVILDYQNQLAQTIIAKKKACESLKCHTETEMLKKMEMHCDSLMQNLKILEKELAETEKIASLEKRSRAMADIIVPCMDQLRADVDALELMIPSSLWPVPSYTDILFHE